MLNIEKKKWNGLIITTQIKTKLYMQGWFDLKPLFLDRLRPERLIIIFSLPQCMRTKLHLCHVLIRNHIVLAAMWNLRFYTKVNAFLTAQKGRFRLPKSTCWQSITFNLRSTSSFWQSEVPFYGNLGLVLFIKLVVRDCR